MLKFGASFCLNKSLFKASKSKRNLFEYAEICTLFCQCVDTKESSKQNNTEKENQGSLNISYAKHAVVDRFPTFITLIPIKTLGIEFSSQFQRTKEIYSDWYLNREFSDSIPMFFEIHGVN